MSAFEVRCHHCNVSFPVGTRRCLHCGGPTGPPLDPSVPQEVVTVPAEPLPPDAALPGPGNAADDEESEQPSRAGIRITTLVWLVLAVVASMWRMCADAGQG